MRKILYLAQTAVLSGVLCCTGSLQARQDAQPAPADNTKVNKRDRKKAEPTADQAKNNASDRETMAKIRKSIVGDKSLSTYAHNVKIIAQNGQVTVKGPVRSADEKTAVIAKATEVAGSGNVKDEVTVRPSKKKM